MRKVFRILQAVAIFMVYLIMTMSVAYAVSFSHNPFDLAVDGIGVLIDGNSAAIRWNTDEDAMAGLRYGIASPPAGIVMGTDTGQEHEVVLSGLEYETEYFYALIARIGGTDEIDDNGGSYYRFTTGPDPGLAGEGDDGTPDYTPPDHTAESEATPFISAIIPRYVHERRVTINGRTAPRATVRIYMNVNEGAVGGVSYDLVTTTNDEGLFSFPRVPLSQEDNVLFLFARSLSGEEGQIRYEVTIDNEVPVVEGDLPDVSNSTTLHYTGTVSEDVTINVTVGENSGASAHSAGPFDVEIPLVDMEMQEVMVTFTDGAGNMVVRRSTIFASTQDPAIYRTNLDTISPSYARDVTLTGNVTPRSYVVVFVNGQTTPDSSWPTSVQEIIKNFGTIISGDQYGTYTEDGLFQIPVLLSQQAASERRVVTAGSPGMTSSSQIEGEIGRENPYDTSFGGYGSTREDIDGRYNNQIEILVISRTGRTSSTGVSEVVYTKCGFGGDYSIDISDVTPTIVIPEHLRRGMAHLGFTVNLEWRGSGVEAQRASPTIRPYKLSEEERREYAIDPEDLISPSSSIIPRVSEDGKTISVLMRLNTVNYTQEDLEDLDLEDLRIKIPLMLELNYMMEQQNCVPGQGISCAENRVQRECWDINTALDIQIPASVVPEDLLTWSITALNDTINVIDSILEPLQIITQVTFYVCLASWVILFVVKVWETYTCTTEGQPDPDCISAKGTTRDVDYGMRWICDRVFCPAAPNFANWAKAQVEGTGPKGITEGKGREGETTQELCKEVVNQGSSTASTSSSSTTTGRTSPTTGGTTGPPMVSVSDAFYTQEASWENYPIETCADEYIHQWDTSCLLMDELGESRCQKARAEGDAAKEQEFCGNFLEQGFRAATSLCKADEVNRFQAVSPVDHNRYEFRRPSWYARPEATSTTETRTSAQTGLSQTTRVETQTESYSRLLDNAEAQRLQLSVRQRDDFVINPTDDLFAALRCVCLPAIQGYLQLWRNIMEAIKQCFQTVLAGGDATSGMCRAVLTTYLCDFIFSVISCFVNAFGAGSGDSSTGEPERGIGGFFQALQSTGSEIQSSVQNRYGASELYRSMFTERKLVHAICLFAFTGDWDLDLDTALGGTGSIPLRSEGFIYPATRRFISSDPNNQGRTTHIYHIGAGLVAGSNIDYRLELVCSANTLCNPDDGFIGGECDCFQSGREQVYDITRELGGGRLDAGDILGRNEGDIYTLIQNAPVRYDKVRMRWRSQRQSETTALLDRVVEQPVEQPISQIGGSSPIDCGYNVGLGEYRCDFDVGARGYAMFRTEPQSVKSQLNAQGQIIPGTTAGPFLLGETMDLNFEVAKQSPNYDPRAADRNAANEIPFFLTYRVKRGSQYIPITNSQEPGQGTDEGLVRIARDGMTAFPRDAHVPGLVVSPAMFSAVGSNTGVTTQAYPLPGGGLMNSFEAMPNTAGATQQDTWFYVRFIPAGTNVQYEMGSVSNYNSQGRESTATLGPAEVSGVVGELGVPLERSFRGIQITPRNIGGQTSVGSLVGKGLVFHYQRPGTTSAQGCDSQDPVTFTIEMEIKYPTTRERADRSAPTEEDVEQGRVTITPTNAIPSSEVVRDPAGQLQRKAVTVQAICRDRAAVNSCVANTRVGAECECGSGSTAQTCSPGDPNINYCQEDGGVYSCAAYNACQPRNEQTVASDARVTLREQNWCDCDADANGRLECARGATCNEIMTSGNWMCSDPRSFALANTYGVPSSTSISEMAPSLLGNPIFHGVTFQEQRVHDSDVSIVRAAQSVISLTATAFADKSQPTSYWAQSKDMEVAINGDISCRGNRVPMGRAASGGTAWPEVCADDDAGGVGVDSGGRITILTPSQMASAAASMRELVSGQPLLLDNGVVQPLIGYCAANEAMCGTQARTAVGLTTDGTLLMVTTDGGTSTSQGMTLTELAQYMLSLGAIRALNMNGGGSSTMYVKGRGVVNSLSDGSERIVINHIGIDAQDLGYVPAPVAESSRVPMAAGEDGSIIFFGHSLVEPGSPLVTAVGNAIGRDITAAGVRSSRISHWLSPGSFGEAGRATRNPADVVRGYELVLVSLGGQRGEIPTADQINQLDAQLRSGGATVIWVGIPQPPSDGPTVQEHRDLWAALRASGVQYVDVGNVALPAGSFGADNVHLTPDGARAWAEMIGDLVQPYVPRLSSVPDVGPGGSGSVTAYRQMSCDGFADSSVPFEAFFTSYHTPSYGSPDGYSAPWTITSGSGASHTRGIQLSGNAPGTDAPWSFFCAVAMECSCPANPSGDRMDQTKRCYAGGQWAYGGERNGWAPCTPFARGTPYCQSTASGSAPIVGRTVAADKDCFDVSSGCMISIDGGPPRKIMDSGTGIRGRRFDAYSSESRGPGDGRVEGVHIVVVLNPEVCQQRASYRGGIP